MIGWALNPFFPINKALWTSSYVVFTAGLGLQLLALCYWLVDIKGYQRWAWPFIVFGMNAIASVCGFRPHGDTDGPDQGSACRWLTNVSGGLDLREPVFVVGVANKRIAGLCDLVRSALVVLDVVAVQEEDIYPSLTISAKQADDFLFSRQEFFGTQWQWSQYHNAVACGSTHS